MKLVDEKLNDLFPRMKQVSQIKISLDLGTHNLFIAEVQKNISHTLVTTFAADTLSLKKWKT